MEWKNIKADFSDSNQLRAIASQQVNQSARNAVDMLTSTAQLYRQAEQDRLKELEMRHSMLIQDKEAELARDKLNQQKLVDESTIGLNNAKKEDISIDNTREDKKVNAEVGKLKIEQDESKARAKLYNTQANQISTNTQLAKQAAEQRKQDAIMARELKMSQDQFTKMRSNGSVGFTVDRDDNGRLVINKVPDMVWYEGKMVPKKEYSIKKNLNTNKLVTDAKNQMVKAGYNVVGTDDKSIDAAVKINGKFFNKGQGNGNLYVNKKTFENVTSTLGTVLDGDIRKLDNVVASSFIYDPKTKGVAIPKKYVKTDGNFKSTLHKNAFLFHSLVQSKTMSADEALKTLKLTPKDLPKINKILNPGE